MLQHVQPQDVELQAELRWASDVARFHAPFASELRWELPFDECLRFLVSGNGHTLDVRREETAISLPLSGGDVELAPGIRLRVQLVVKPRESSPSVFLGTNTIELQRPLDASREFTAGRTQADLTVTEPCFRDDGPHFVLAVQRPTKPGAVARLWLADNGSESGTFVNQQRVFATVLETNDLIQVGPFGWVVWRDESHFRLIPISGIEGVGLVITDMVTQNLRPISLEIQPGEFIAISGPSGGGKSTFLKALAGVLHVRTGGRLYVRERSGEIWEDGANPDRFRQLLGYVSQESVLHDSLTPPQALRYAAALRGQVLDNTRLDWLLLRAEIPPMSRANPIRTLSGGENKRLRTAAELVSSPGLLLLDEPDSGLDAERRRRLLKHLKTLSRQGCTILVVTHGSQDFRADGFDRVLRIEAQQLIADTPSKLPSACETRAKSPSTRQLKTTQRRRQQQLRKTFQQLIPLVSRELDLWLADAIPCPLWLQRFLPDRAQAFPGRLLAMVGVAIVFASALAVAVPSHHHHLLGFLSVVSVIWMSSSLSLMAIVGERAVFDHERHSFLRLVPYVLSKLAVHNVLAWAQCAVFVMVLVAFRSASTTTRTPTTSFIPGQALASGLTLLGIASVGVALGLCLSAFANRRKELATVLLPLVMIAQMVFSVPIAVGRPNDSLEVAYRDFRWRTAGTTRDHRPAAALSAHSLNTVDWPQTAAYLSYLTVSRPGDIALRAINDNRPRTPDEMLVAKSAVIAARFHLLSFFIFFTTATLLLLSIQSRTVRQAGSPMMAES